MAISWSLPEVSLAFLFPRYRLTFVPYTGVTQLCLPFVGSVRADGTTSTEYVQSESEPKIPPKSPDSSVPWVLELNICLPECFCSFLPGSSC